MKKSLLALAVLGAFATAAQAQVTIGGIVQANVKNYKVSDTNTNPTFGGVAGRTPSNELRVDDDYTSRFWLTGTEDLGGGNAALFYIENRLNTDQGGPTNTAANGVGNGLGNGDTFVGLKGAWGQLTAGKHTMMYTQGLATELGKNGISAIPSSMWGTFSILDQIGGAYVTVSRVQNSLMYRTPNISGFSGSVGYSTQGAGNEGNLAGATNGDYSKGQDYFLQASYANGPIYVNAAYWNQQTEGRPTTPTAALLATGGVATNADISQARLSASYLFPFGLKVGAQFDRASAKDVTPTGVLSTSGEFTGRGNITRNAWEIPVSYTFGASTLLASYTKAGDLGGSTIKSGAKMYTLGYDYALSKRTNVGVFYSKLKNDAGADYQPFLAGTSATGSALLPGETATTFAVGVKHTF